MKRLFLAFIFFFVLAIDLCSAQSNKLANGSAWTIYDVKGAKFYSIKIDTLHQLPHRELDSDTMRAYLKKATILLPKQVPAWMGAYVVSYVYQNQTNKVDISTYGGFLYDERSQTFYEVAAEEQQSWRNYLAQNINALISSE